MLKDIDVKTIQIKKLKSLNILATNKHNLYSVTVDSIAEYVRYFGVDDNYKLVTNYFHSNTDTLLVVGSFYSIPVSGFDCVNIFREVKQWLNIYYMVL